MNKSDNLFFLDSCLNKAEADEPIFIIRAKDICGSMTVRHWAEMARGRHDANKVALALALADEMEAWRDRKFPPAK